MNFGRSRVLILAAALLLASCGAHPKIVSVPPVERVRKVNRTATTALTAADLAMRLLYPSNPIVQARAAAIALGMILGVIAPEHRDEKHKEPAP